MAGGTLAGGPTKEEIIAVSIDKLRLQRDASVIEVGCGSGAVTAMLAAAARTVTAIDSREEAVRATEERLVHEGLRNVSCLHGSAATLLPGLPPADAAFVGGSQDLVEVLHILSGKVRGRIVVNAVQIATLSSAIATFRELGIFHEVVSVQVARTVPIGGDMMFRPCNPVFIVVGGGSKC